MTWVKRGSGWSDVILVTQYVEVRLEMYAFKLCQLLVPRRNLSTYARRAFSVAGPAAWNSLCDELREPSLAADSFRQLLKTRLFAE